ncbi:hypothetical protein CC1G_02263 [Coprinopsis cinerea okayama7|uniref:Uncharacterized protein n=1 Tax=Coprinopsis cinerea (strain Okayama-7 / 130 / ATCC MYA-4618 / FGSC 9003) TaxID=240176 RepID=A8N7K6_COPC7|nr:hypothetical protein CC1G_02263 [Coprinopsis cinerea okayama7\|eukprot:XP_001830812.2 hypothetical protein CC1G_02263 [Coprinopsis cinerea okayama7\
MAQDLGIVLIEIETFKFYVQVGQRLICYHDLDGILTLYTAAAAVTLLICDYLQTLGFEDMVHHEAFARENSLPDVAIHSAHRCTFNVTRSNQPRTFIPEPARSPLPGLDCVYISPSESFDGVAICYCILLAGELCIAVLGVTVGFKDFLRTKSSLARTMYRDGTWYYITLLGLSTLNVAAPYTKPVMSILPEASARVI